MGKFLVTGGAGFIGSAIAKRLCGDGHDVVIIDDLSTGYEDNVPDRCRFVRADVADPNTYDEIANDSFDAILHLAGQSSGEISFEDPVRDICSNTISTVLLLRYALKTKCSRFLFASTMSVYGEGSDNAVSEQSICSPRSFYGVSKLASERYLNLYEMQGIQSTAFRLFNVYGPGQNLSNLKQGMVSIYLAQVLKNGHVHVKGAKSRFRDFIFITDVVDAFVGSIYCEGSFGKEINIGSGTKTTVESLIAVMKEHCPVAFDVTYEGSTPGDINGIFADVTLMREVLGHQTPTTLAEGIEQTFNKYFQSD